MNENQFFAQLNLLLKDLKDPLDRDKVINYYKDKLNNCSTDEERVQTFKKFKSPEHIVRPILAMQNFTQRSEIKKPYSITIGFASLFSKFKENKSFLKRFVNTIIILLISAIVIFFIGLSAVLIYFGIKLFFKFYIFGISIRFILTSISFLSFGIAILLLQIGITSLRHLPYLGLAILKRMK